MAIKLESSAYGQKILLLN